MLEVDSTADLAAGTNDLSAPPAIPPLNGGLTASDLAVIESLREKLIREVQIGYCETRKDAERRVRSWAVKAGLADDLP